jgi:hypothetical protein
MRPFKYTLGLHAAGAAAGIAAAQAGTAGVPLTLTATPVVNDVPRTVVITSVGDETGNRFAIEGSGPKGNSIIESVTGANAGTVETQNVFATVTAITPEVDTAANVSAGTSSNVPTPWIPLDHVHPDSPAQISLQAPVGVLGLSAAVEITMDSLAYQGSGVHHGSKFDIAFPDVLALAPDTPITLAAAGETVAALPMPVTAVRVLNTGPLTAGELNVRIVQGHGDLV